MTDKETEAAEPCKPFMPIVGDVAMLKSGGPAMTVIGLPAPGGDQDVLCQWFNPLDHCCCEKRFLVIALVACDCAKGWQPLKA